LLFSHQIIAQVDTTTLTAHKKFSIAVYGGASFATGDFAKFQTINPTVQNSIKGYNDFSIAGAGKMGNTVGCKFIYSVCKKIELGVDINRSAWGTNDVQYPEMYDPQNVLAGSELSYEAKNWTALNFLFAPSYVFGKRNTKLAVMVLLGMQQATSPKTTMSIQTIAIDPFNGDDLNQNNYTQPSFSDWSLTYGIGMEGRQQLSRKSTFFINCNYLNSKHAFASGSELEYQVKRTSLGSTTTYNYKIPINFNKQISAVTVSAGIKFAL
jgi:hypothetical protein